ncbi:MAG: type II restriction endonuclease [Candidatus ainarchaeum sp.]|nr:type II restriction endonuclease [Candidatus ainarchaeum sp.]
MKYIEFYKKEKISEKEVFAYFLNTLKPSIMTYDYFLNWEKINSAVSKYKIELNLLNSLLNSENIESEFKSLIIKYPNLIPTLPVLLAVRDQELNIIKDYKSKDLTYTNYKFDLVSNIGEKEAKQYFIFFKETGLINLFLNKKIKNLVDYVYGVEAGLDSNGRKNRTGKVMEKVVEIFISELISKNKNLEYLSQATAHKIKDKWGYVVEFDKSARSFDFAIYNTNNKKIFLIETNFYNGGGSKLKSVCSEFKFLYNTLKSQNIDFIWITDGNGWNTTKKPLEEAFNQNDYIFNLGQLEKDILKEIICK